MAEQVRVVKEDGTEVKEGDTIIDFRGKAWTFISVTRVTRGAMIYAKDQARSNWKQEFYESVFKLKIIWPEKPNAPGS